MARRRKLKLTSKKIKLPKFDLSLIKSIRGFKIPKIAKKGNKRLGFAAVFVGIAIALVTGALANIFNWQASWIYWILAIGVIVGVLNIFHKEGILFLIVALAATFALTMLAGLTVFPAWIINLIGVAVYFLAPASLIVSLKVFYALASK